MTIGERYFDELEIQPPLQRRHAIFSRLREFINEAKKHPGWNENLAHIRGSDIHTPEDLSKLPVLRKSELSALQKSTPPLGGFGSAQEGRFSRLFESPGPIFEPQGRGSNYWRFARAFFAAGFRAGDIVHNTFSYHLTPGGWIVDSGLTSLGCTVIPAGTGNIEQQISAIAQFRPTGYTGTPDFLKILLDKAENSGIKVPSISKALVSGGALFPKLRKDYNDRGISVYQAYATAELGLIAYETEALEGMIVDEDCLVEIVRPGTGDPVPDGEVGEVVVTTFNEVYPMIRLATGDLSAVTTGQSSCGRTNIRLKGWLGRADQTAKVRGMFVNPGQVAEIEKCHSQISRVRLVISRDNDRDKVTLVCAGNPDHTELEQAIKSTFQRITKLNCDVAFAEPNEWPNDGLVIADERNFET